MFKKVGNIYFNLNNVEIIDVSEDKKKANGAYDINIRFVDGKYIGFQYDTQEERDKVLDYIVNQ